MKEKEMPKKMMMNKKATREMMKPKEMMMEKKDMPCKMMKRMG